jgi:multiple sugar transport system substrate-binding protein
LTSPEVTQTWSRSSGYVPVRLSALKSEAYQEFLKAHPAMQGALAGLDSAVSQPRVTGWESIRGLLDDAMFEAMSQKVSPEEAIKRAVAKTDELLTNLQGQR